MIIDSKEELLKVVELITNKDLICVPIFSDNKKHYKENKISILYFKVIGEDLDIILPLNHSESFSIPFDRNVFDRANTIFTYNKKAVNLFSNSVDLELTLSYNLGSAPELEDYDTPAHLSIQRSFYTVDNINEYIPILKHQEKCKNYIKALDTSLLKVSPSLVRYDTDVIKAFRYVESAGVKVSYELFLHKFKSNGLTNQIAHTEYNLNTKTGRPSNRFGGINYAALNKKDGSRDVFVSRFGPEGVLLQFDFESYHLRLIANLMGYEFETNDLHTYFGKQYFNTEDLTDEQREESKGLTFQLLYSDKKKDCGVPFFEQADKFADTLANSVKQYGRMYSHYYNKPFIEPEKNKLFNYYIQNIETERNIGLILEIEKILKDYDTKMVLYTYDSFLFDFKLSDGKELVDKIRNVLEQGNYPTKAEIGVNYGHMRES